MLTGTPGRLLAPAPSERLATIRILVTGFALVYLIVRLPHLVDVARLAEEAPERFDPVGPLRALDSPPSVAVVLAAIAITVGSGLAALVGWRWRLSGPIFALGVLVVLSYRNSWGQIFHTENLLVIHLVILAFCPAADTLAIGKPRSTSPPHPKYGWPAQLMVVAVVVAYVLAGWAKVQASGLEWGQGDVLANLVAHDSLRKEVVGSSVSPLAALALEWRWIFTPIAMGSLIVELIAPVALFGGRWRVGWAVSAIVFHVGVLVIMGILFPYQLFGVAFAAFVTVEALPGRWGNWRGRRAILTT